MQPLARNLFSNNSCLIGAEDPLGDEVMEEGALKHEGTEESRNIKHDERHRDKIESGSVNILRSGSSFLYHKIHQDPSKIVSIRSIRLCLAKTVLHQKATTRPQETS